MLVQLTNLSKSNTQPRKQLSKIKIHPINEPRRGKKLLVLDLDYTLLDSADIRSCAPTIWASPSAPRFDRARAAPPRATAAADTRAPCRNATERISDLKRPYCDEFLERVQRPRPRACAAQRACAVGSVLSSRRCAPEAVLACAARVQSAWAGVARLREWARRPASDTGGKPPPPPGAPPSG